MMNVFRLCSLRSAYSTKATDKPLPGLARVARTASTQLAVSAVCDKNRHSLPPSCHVRSEDDLYSHRQLHLSMVQDGQRLGTTTPQNVQTCSSRPGRSILLSPSTGRHACSQEEGEGRL